MLIFISTLIILSFTTTYANKKYMFMDDTTGAQKMHSVATPRVGGIAVFITFFASLFFNESDYGFFLLPMTLTFLIGLIDDFSPISPKVRFIFLAFTSFVFLYMSGSFVTSIGFIPIFYMLGFLIAFVGIIGVTNAINIIDGFNGLVAMLAIFYLGSFYYVVDDNTILYLIRALMIGFFAFFFFNFPRAITFLGDGGSYMLGFALGSMSVYITYTNQDISTLYPLALLIYPIYETIFSIRRKRKRNISPFVADGLDMQILIYKRVTRDNPKTSIYINMLCLPFVVISTIFYDNDFVLILTIASFIYLYNYFYNRLVNFS